MNILLRISLLSFFLTFQIFGQDRPKKMDRHQGRSRYEDSLTKSVIGELKLQNKKAVIKDYLIINKNNDTTYVDTTLTIQKEYKFNYLRRDNFGLMPFSNVGQTYNSLSADFSEHSTLPLFGARARHFNYMEEDDIYYYRVPTPLTELFWKTAFEQGQILDAFFSVNTSPNLNLSIAYKGLRSLGNYQHILTSTGNLRFTTNYTTKNRQYKMRAHMVFQDLMNEENGGLRQDELENFTSGDPDFLDRSVFDPNFENAQNILRGKRFYLEQSFEITKATDSINHLTVGNITSFEDKYYQFDQDNRSDIFGDAFRSSQLSDRATLEYFRAMGYVQYENKILGRARFAVSFNSTNYGYDNIVQLEDEFIPNRIKGNTLSVEGQYEKKLGRFDFQGQLKANISGLFTGNDLQASAQYDTQGTFDLGASLHLNSRSPNYNKLLYQSDYINYNWNNSDDFENLNLRQLAFHLKSKKLFDADLELINIDNYTYFAYDELAEGVKPFQAGENLNYLKIKIGREFKVGKFALDNTFMYQKVTNGDDILNVPEFIARNTLYFSSHVFKKALFLQTGITLNYFTEYNMNAYDPVLAEFYIQNGQMFGGFPRLDFFLNAKIRQTRIFIKAEHFNSSFTGYDYFSAPTYPYRDFGIRLGIVWNFFL